MPRPDDAALLGDVRRTQPVVADYARLAQIVFKRRLGTGLFANLDPEVAAQLITDYADRLEDITNRKILERLDELGRDAEAERMVDADVDLHAYFTLVIPDYENFLAEATQAAMLELLFGERV